ncbi:hypothetical protein [Massilia orientalis]|uniref:Uncharacterized protein n=1 Tax=Massilia orientalis TaxID=3050128 RepID=A0ACC7MAF2_9BURK|nr:hypothetical protein [Massilia sp. YIM B02787]
MQHFYRKALGAFVLLLAADALIAGFCIHRSAPSASTSRYRTPSRIWARAALQFEGTADLSRYSTVSFLAKCAPAHALPLN